MKKKIWLISLVLLLAVSIVYTGCAAPAPVEEEKGPIKIGVLAPLSGGFASFGSRLKAALEIHVEDINAEGGLLERPVELTFRDTKFNPEAALREARDLIEGQNCDFLIGCVNSSCSLVVSEYVKTLNGRTLQIVGTSTSTDITMKKWHRYIFSASYRAESATRGVAELAAEKWGDTARRIYTICPDYAAGHAMVEAVLEYWAETMPEAELVGEAWPPIGTTEFTAYITAILAAEPDIVYSGLWAADGLAFLSQAAPFGFLDEVPFVNQEMGTHTTLSELREGDVAAPIGCLGSEWYPWYIMDTPENNRFVAEVYKRCGLYPDGGGYLYGNGILFLKAAIEKAGSADVEKVVDALEGITITPFGFADITMRACDHQDMLPIYSGVIGWDPTGKYPFPILLPETIRTADDPADWYYTCEKAVAGRE